VAKFTDYDACDIGLSSSAQVWVAEKAGLTARRAFAMLRG
jgi:hypothetical protein